MKLKYLKQLAEKNKKEGAEFLAADKAKEGVKDAAERPPV
jgi:hypothetical protein